MINDAYIKKLKGDGMNMTRCPFCGGVNIDVIYSSNVSPDDREMVRIRRVCRSCEATGPAVIGVVGEDSVGSIVDWATELWNSRKA